MIEGRSQIEHIDWMMIYVSIFSNAVSRSIHLFPYNLQCSTNVEQLLRKAAALIVAIAPSLSALSILLGSVVKHLEDTISKGSVIVYLSARLYIILESFRSLFFATWNLQSDLSRERSTYWMRNWVERIDVGFALCN